MHHLISHYAKPSLEKSKKLISKDLKEIERIEESANSALPSGYYNNRKAELRMQIHEIDEALEELEQSDSDFADLKESIGEFNRALTFALELGSDDGLDFLRCWNEGDWAGCQSFGFVAPVSDELSKGVPAN